MWWLMVGVFTVFCVAGYLWAMNTYCRTAGWHVFVKGHGWSYRPARVWLRLALVHVCCLFGMVLGYFLMLLQYVVLTLSTELILFGTIRTIAN